MKILVGLGNPGEEYKNTRHNTGYIMLGLVQKKLNTDGKIKFVYPDKFMNNSGKVVGPMIKSKKSARNVTQSVAGGGLKDLVVIYDDIDLPLGKMKISFNRSSGGHNGLGSIIKALKSEEFVRIRVGISPETPGGKLRKPKGEKAVLNFLLGEYKKSEFETLKKLSTKVAEAVQMIFREGKDKAMSLYNS